MQRYYVYFDRTETLVVEADSEEEAIDLAMARADPRQSETTNIFAESAGPDVPLTFYPSEIGDFAHQMLDFIETVALGNTDPDRLAEMARDLIAEVREAP